TNIAKCTIRAEPVRKASPLTPTDWFRPPATVLENKGNCIILQTGCSRTTGTPCLRSPRGRGCCREQIKETFWSYNARLANTRHRSTARHQAKYSSIDTAARQK